MKQIIEREHRLDKNCYRGFVCATFTLCISGGTNYFYNMKLVEIFLEMLKRAMDKYKTLNWVYIFMPNHLHLILEGISEESDLLKCISLFKQLTGYWFSKNDKRIKWQKDFYDHIHRKDEDLRRQILYILENPVRKGLVEDWTEYSFKGSLSYQLQELVP